MADITITAADVVAASTATQTPGTAGETVDAGEIVYLDTSTSPNKYKLCDSSTAALAKAAGMALNSAALDQPIDVLTDGTVTITANATVGESYFVSSNGGKLQPDADLGSNEYVTYIGTAVTTSTIKIKINQTGAQVP